MIETVTRLFDTSTRAQLAVDELRRAGFTDDAISLVVPADETDHISDLAALNATGGAEIGAGVGGFVGAGAGILTGLGLMAIPGVGPVVAAGWLATTLAGAVAGALAGGASGGIIGTLMDARVDETDAHVYAESMRRGASLVTVRAPDGRAVDAHRILDALTPVDMTARGAEYRHEGWLRFDETATPAAKVARPHAHFEEPAAVVDDPLLSTSEKMLALDALEQDARQLAVASSEGMSGGEPVRLNEVLVAKEAIQPELPSHPMPAETTVKYTNPEVPLPSGTKAPE